MTADLHQDLQVIRYFAYGSNLSSRRLLARTPAARVLATAQLMGYRLSFHKPGSDGSGKCCVLPDADRRNFVRGVLWQLPSSEKSTLDVIEGLGLGYDEAMVTLVLPDGSSSAGLTYIATGLDTSLRPYTWYREHVLQGMLEHRFPHDEVHRVRLVPADQDPDGKRHQTESSLHL